MGTWAWSARTSSTTTARASSTPARASASTTPSTRLSAGTTTSGGTPTVSSTLPSTLTRAGSKAVLFFHVATSSAVRDSVVSVEAQRRYLMTSTMNQYKEPVFT